MSQPIDKMGDDERDALLESICAQQDRLVILQDENARLRTVLLGIAECGKCDICSESARLILDIARHAGAHH